MIREPRSAAPGETVVVDRVGVLGDLYALADVAYVGGGWGTAGLHSVLEPAAGDAGDGWLAPLLRDSVARHAAGDAARAYVQANLGAAERGSRIIERLLETPGFG